MHFLLIVSYCYSYSNETHPYIEGMFFSQKLIAVDRGEEFDPTKVLKKAIDELARDIKATVGNFRTISVSHSLTKLD